MKFRFFFLLVEGSIGTILVGGFSSLYGTIDCMCQTKWRITDSCSLFYLDSVSITLCFLSHLWLLHIQWCS